MSLKRNALLALAGAAFITGTQCGLRNSRRISFDCKAALVTGGSRGLGLLIAEELTRRGCRVLVCSRHQEELERAAAHDPTGRLRTVRADLTVEDDLRKVVEAVRTELGKLDILVNNAGVIISGPQETMRAHDYERLLKIHFWAPYYLTNELLPELRQSGTGRIANICSIGSKVAIPHRLPYAVSKYALCGYSEGLRAELKKDGILVTTVCPSIMRTGSQVRALFKGDLKREYAGFRLMSAIPGMSVSAERAARMVVNSIEYGDAELLIGPAAKIGARLQALAPETMALGLELAEKVLPQSQNTRTRQGRHIEIPGIVTALTSSVDRAAEQFNEIEGAATPV